MSDFITLIFDLVTTDDVLEVVVLYERCCDVRAELYTNAPFAGRAAILWLWIGPQ